MVEEYKTIESELQSYENFVMAKEWVIRSGLLAQETYGTSDELGKENQNQNWESWDASHISNLRSEQKIYNFFKAKMVDFFRKKNIGAFHMRRCANIGFGFALSFLLPFSFFSLPTYSYCNPLA